jgi:hypothetical protein
MGVRFNIFEGTIYPVQTLDATSAAAPSCTNGNERFTVTGPPTQETPAGATICAFKNHNGLLIGVAFNPATGYVQVLGVGGDFITPPICTNANDGTNQVICALAAENVVSGVDTVRLEGVAFDPRTSFVTPFQTLYSGTLFDGTGLTSIEDGSPGCATADTSGKVLCAVRSSTNTLVGFAFDPRTGFASTLQPLGSIPMIGSPSCSGVADKSNKVICAMISSTDIVNSIEFDPRTGASSGLVSSGISSATDLSCTFQNANPAQVSCAGLAKTSPGELFGIVLTQ